MLALHYLIPVVSLIPSPLSYFGVLPILIGLALNLCASNFFGKVKTTVKPFEQSTCLLTTGLFKYSRNPMYLGMALALLGLFLLLGSLTPLFIVPAFSWIMDRKFIRIEEKDLEKTFGEEFLRYKSKVRRWI